MPSLSTNSAVTLRIEVRDIEDELVNPDSIELVWKLGRNGDENTVAQADLTHDSTGIYSAEVTPEDPATSGTAGGVVRGAAIHLYYEFRMTNPTYIERGKVALSTSEFCG